MKFLPLENVTFHSKLYSEEIKCRLNGIVEPEKTFRTIWSYNDKPYEGSLNGDSFEITRIISYSNSFLPSIKGVIQKTQNGTRINVKIRLQLFTTIFLSIWFGGIIIGYSIFLITLSHVAHLNPLTLLPVGIMIFTYAFMLVGFKYESIKSKKYLAKLFEADNQK